MCYQRLLPLSFALRVFSSPVFAFRCVSKLNIKKKNLNKHFHTNGILLWTTRLWERGSVRNVNRVIFLDVKLFCLGRMLPRYVHMVQHEALVPKFISYHPAFPPSLSVCSLSSGSATSRLNQSQHTFHAGLQIHLTES